MQNVWHNKEILYGYVVINTQMSELIWQSFPKFLLFTPLSKFRELHWKLMMFIDKIYFMMTADQNID